MAHIWRKKYKNDSRILDKFYTKQEVVKRCLEAVNKLLSCEAISPRWDCERVLVSTNLLSLVLCIATGITDDRCLSAVITPGVYPSLESRRDASQ